MNKLRKFIILFLSVVLSNLQAQSVGIGEWDSYYAFTNALDVAEGDKKIFWISDLSAVYYDTEDFTINKLSKIEGLTQTGLNEIEYNATTGYMVLGYFDGNIDLVKFDENNKPVVVNMSDIKRSTLTGDKKIYNIYSYNEFIYVSCGFGIVKIDLSKTEVNDTYIIGNLSTQIKVNGVCIGNDTIYAATENGLYKAYQYHPFLNYYAAWSKMNASSLPPWLINKGFKAPAYINNKLFIIPDYPAFGQDTAYYRDGGVWAKVPLLNGIDFVSFSRTSGGYITMATLQNVSVVNDAFVVQADLFSYYGYLGLFTNNAIFASDGLFYSADLNNGPIKSVNSWSGEQMTPGGTKTAAVRRATFDGDNTLWIAPGQVGSSIFANTFNRDFFSVKEGNDWIYINSTTDPILLNDVFDVMDIAVDPLDTKHVMAAAWSFQGLIEIQDKVVTNLWDETNSILYSPPGFPDFCGVASLTYDEDGNLWMTNGQSSSPLVVKKADGTWKSFYCGPEASSRTYYDIMVDQNKYKYIPVPTRGATAGGLLVYNDNNTIDDETDDQYKFYRTPAGQGNLPDADVRCAVEDLNGEIWVGTAKGPTVIFNPGSIFSGGSYDAQHILIQQDGNTQILLETEIINDIVVDGANRKWIATENSGIYLVSEDGQQQLEHFDESNSPMPTSAVVDLEMNGKTGELFIVTRNGMLSYRGTATESNNRFNNINIFPNPVRPGYSGPIAINGLSINSDVKITDVAGNIVNVVKSEGGQAIWDGTNLKGQKVSTGIYLFLCSSEDGSEKVAGKLMFFE